jgi:hypothetical protein
MPSFDYITAKEFREALEADHLEMHRCAEAQAWKSVQVLAGSIVEALLIDYLTATPNPTRPKKDPLKVDLGEAIVFCKNEGVLSDRTADLCSVVKSYRNLIHPGRMVRLEEQPPSESSSKIALALVDLIAEEISKARRKVSGLTAEQLLSKIQRDHNSLSILKHLINEVSESQRERLLIDLIPAAYESIDPLDETGERLEVAFRVVLESVTPAVRENVAAEFVRILREDDGWRVLQYGIAFFRPSDLKFVPSQHQAMVREHLLGRAPSPHTLGTLKVLNGIAEHLQPEDVPKWLDPFIRTFASNTVKDVVKNSARALLLDEAGNTISHKVDNAIAQRLEEWVNYYDKSGIPDQADYIREIKKEIDALQIPF